MTELIITEETKIVENKLYPTNNSKVLKSQKTK